MDPAAWCALGTLLGGLVALRTVCAHLVDLDCLPRWLQRRIELGNRAAPWLAGIAMILAGVGVVLMMIRP